MYNYSGLGNDTEIPKLIDPEPKVNKANIGFIFAMIGLSMCFLIAIIGVIGSCFVDDVEENSNEVEMQDFINIDEDNAGTANTRCLQLNDLESSVIGSSS